MSDNQLQHGRRRVTYTQLLNLWEFLNSHRDVAVGFNKSAQARERSKRMWERVASILNSTGEGATKTGTEWSKYWIDLKAKLKRKNRLNRDSRTGTGGGPSTEQPLSEIELKFLSIMGEDYGMGLPGVQVIPVIPEEIQSSQTNDSFGESGSGHSHPSTSTDENPIYLEINLDDSSPFLVNNTVVIEQPLPEEPEIEQPSLEVAPSTPIPPASAANVHPNPGTATGSSVTAAGSSVTAAGSSVIAASRATTAGSSVIAARSSVTAAGSSVGIQQRRRQVRQRRMTAGEARERLVSSSETRAQSEATNSTTIQQGLALLYELVAVLKRIKCYDHIVFIIFDLKYN